MTATGACPAVVVAEDDEDIAQILAEALRADGVADPIVVSNGALVIDAVISSGARLLLLDVQMPGASGIDVYDVVRDVAIWSKLTWSSRIGTPARVMSCRTASAVAALVSGSATMSAC